MLAEMKRALLPCAALALSAGFAACGPKPPALCTATPIAIAIPAPPRMISPAPGATGLPTSGCTVQIQFGNDFQSQSLHLTDPNGTVMKSIPQHWEDGMGRFVKMSGSPVTVIAYTSGATGSDNVPL